MGIEVVELTTELEKVYADFACSDERSMIYASLEFRNFLRGILVGEPRYLLALESSRIVGALPLFVASHQVYGTVVNSLPWYGSYGGCVTASDSSADIRVALLARYREIVAAEDVKFSTMILSPHEERYARTYLDALDCAVTDRRIGQITNLPENGEDLENRLEGVFAQKTRNLVRKARKQGFSIHDVDDDVSWTFLCETHRENMLGIGGKAKPAEHFLELRKNIPRRWRQLLIASFNGQPVAALLLLRYKNTIEYLTPVIKHEFRPMQPLSFLIWHGMRDAVKCGFRWWNWGGTWHSQKSLHHFKSGWGARDHLYTYVVSAKPDALGAFRTAPEKVAAAFPFYFIYPFHLLA